MTILSSSTPVSSVPQTQNALVNALIGGTKWGGPVGSGVALTYSFITTASSALVNYGFGGAYAGEPWNGFASLTATQRDAARDILGDLARAVNITFTEVTDSGNSAGELRFGMTSRVSPDAAAHAYYPNTAAEGGDVWIRNASAYYASLPPGSFNYLILVHEIGHALGLKHPFDGSPRLPSPLDNRGVTVMSYAASFPEARSFLPLDLITLQVIYGRNMNTATGDDRYVPTGFGGGIRTIWDAGGTDIFDFTTSGASLSISLEPGTVRTASVPYAIAYDTWIENAATGAGHDVIDGNAVANHLSGGAGNDTLRGFAADDVLDGQLGNDRLRGDAGDDRLNGGHGRDIALYAAPAAAIAWRRNADGTVTVEAAGEGRDILLSVEAIQAGDRGIALDQPLRRDLDGDHRGDLLTRQDGTGAVMSFTFGPLGAPPIPVAPPVVGAVLLGSADVGGDGVAELLWRLPGGAGLQFRPLAGGGAPTLFDPGTAWTVRATGDLDGDTKADLLWGTEDGQSYIWLMEGNYGSARHRWLDSPGVGWTIQGIGDVDGDGRGDVIWRHESGVFWTWTMDGTTLTGGGGQPSPGEGWHIRGIGDLDGDHKADVVWRHDNGMLWAWFMDGAIAARNAPIGNPGPEWDVVAFADASGDGIADLIHRNVTGAAWYWVMQGAGIAGAGFVSQQSTDWNFIA